MKKFKILILLILPVILCGCNATYNLHITKNFMTEEVIINDNINGGMTLEEIKHTYPELTIDYNNAIEDDDINNLEDGTAIYNRNIEKIDNNYQIKYKYDKFTRNNIANSNIGRIGFKNIGYIYNLKDNYIQISTNNKMDAFTEFNDLDNVTINITVDYNVKENNADSVNGNVYTWNFNKENTNRNILLVMDMTENNSSKNEESNSESNKVNKNKDDKKEDEENEESSNQSSWRLILVFLGIFVIIIIILFKIKK